MLIETHTRGGSASPVSPGRISPAAALRIFSALLALALVSFQAGCVGLTAGSPADALTFSPGKIDFGSVVAGKKKSQAVTLTNSTGSAVTVPQATIAGTSYNFSGLALPATLDPGQSITFSVVFQPTSPGAASGALVVSTGDSGIVPESLALSGMGLSASGPTITTEPSSQSVPAGQSATFSVSAVGTDPVTYQWQKNGAAISGATSASYTIARASSSDSGSQFTVVVTDAIGSVTSNPATLTVTASALPPSITSQPVNTSVLAGQSATFSVLAAGTTPLSYQWRKNGANISGATSASYTTPPAASSDSGSQFSVVVTNVAGSAVSNPAVLTVNAPLTITGQPASQSVVAGQTATFSVTASSSFSISYQWRKNGVNISGATASSYTTPPASSADNGAQFSVVLTSGSASVTSSSATLTVTAAPVAPSITSQPADKTVAAGQTATFSVAATGTSPLAYQWRKNGAPISGATSPSYTTPAAASADSGAQYTVTVSNSVGSLTSNPAVLTVLAPPSITSQPASLTILAGQTATFSVTAAGAAPLSYQWKKNGTPISGATSATYTTPPAAASDNGAQFTVVVSNSADSVTSSAATLDVNTPPSISSQPASKTVVAGQTATFSVTAAGTAPLSYQWKKNGTPISGATSATYTTPPAAASDNGAQFTVTISNLAGSLTSNAATLSVNPATLLLDSSASTLNFGSVSLGSSKQMPAQITNSGNSGVSLSGVTLSGPGFTVSGISSGTTLAPGQSATLNVTFAPSSTGGSSGSIVIASNATNSPLTITLSGSGVQPVPHTSTLSWTASTSPVAGYNAYRGTISGGPYTKLNSSLIVQTTFSDSTVQAGQTYYYVVAAVDSNGDESVYSNQAAGIVPTP